MPQMAPISWLFLFIMFTIIFMMFNIMNYYIFFYSTSSKNLLSKKQTKSFNWKW